MFPKATSLEALNATGDNSMVSHIGIEFIEVGEDYLLGRMPVDERTKQPMGLLHGGASVAFAESLGSVASVLVIGSSKSHAVGIEINANHIKSARSGYVYGRVTPLHVGKRTHVWEIKITDESDQLICISRLTTAIVERK